MFKMNNRATYLACRGVLLVCRGILPLCRGILSVCRGILSVCRGILSVCRGILSVCRGILFVCRGILLDFVTHAATHKHENEVELFWHQKRDTLSTGFSAQLAVWRKKY